MSLYSDLKEVLTPYANKIKGLAQKNTELKADLDAIVPGLSDAAKEALLACFEHVAWIDDDGQDYYDALEEALSSEPEPEYEHKIEYKSSDGVVLSQASGFEVVSESIGTMQESIVDGVLHIVLPSGTSMTRYVMIRLANYTPTEHHKARARCRLRLNALSGSSEENGYTLTIKAGESCAGIYTHKNASTGKSYIAIRNSSNVAVDTNKEISMGTWYNLEAVIDNGYQTIKIDGETIYTGAGNTYFGSSGNVFTKTDDSTGILNMDISQITLEWT